MSIPPCIVNSARMGWRWEWKQLMNGLAPADKAGSYIRPQSQHLKAKVPSNVLSKILVLPYVFHP